MRGTRWAVWMAVPCAVVLMIGRATAAPVTGILNGSFEETTAVGVWVPAASWTEVSGLDAAYSLPSGTEVITATDGARFLRLSTDGAYSTRVAQYLGTMVAGETYTFTADAVAWFQNGFYSTPGYLDPWAATAAFVNEATVAPSVFYKSQLISGLLEGQTGTFNLSYTATGADDGHDLYIWLQAEPNAAGASRGGIDNARLVNVIPSIPTGPNPADSAVDVPVASTLSWSSTPGAMGYQVSLWTVDGPTNTSDVLVPAWSPGTLQKSTNYYWQVVATNEYGAATGAVWTFATPVPVPIANVLNGSFEDITGTSKLEPYGIYNAEHWDDLTVGLSYEAGSTAIAGPMGNFEGIAPGNVTGARYMRLASEVAVHYGAIAQNLGAMEAGKTYTLKADVFGGNGSGIGGGGMLPGVWRASLQSDSSGSATVYAAATSGNLTQGAFAPDGLIVSYTATASDAGNDLWIKYWVPAVAGSEAFMGGIDNVRLSLAKPPAISGVINGSFEDVTGTDNKLPTLDIYNAVGWVELTVGVPWEVGSTTTTGPNGNYEGIDAGSVTGARYMRVATDDTANFGLIAQFLGSMEEGKTYTLTADVLGGAGTVDGDWQARLQSDIVGSPTVYATASSGPIGAGVLSPDGLIVSYTATASDAGNPLWIQYTIPPVGAVAFRGGIDNVRLAMLSPGLPPEPTAPSPTNGEVNVAATGNLTWSAPGATGYRVLLWPVGDPTNTFEGSGFTLNPGTNRVATEYQWQVVATNAYGSATGAVWTFTTGLHNGSFEEAGATLVAYPTDGLKEAVGWINLSGAGYAYQASSMDTGGMASESWPVTPSAGSRVLRLVSDESDIRPLQIGRIAQNLGTMVAGQTYIFTADALGGSDALIPWGATAKFVGEAVANPGTVYAAQTVSGIAQGVTSVNAFSLSYTAMPGDDGKPLVIWLQAEATAALVASRGGIDNARLTVFAPAAEIPFSYVYEPDSAPPNVPEELSAPYMLNDGLIGSGWDSAAQLYSLPPFYLYPIDKIPYVTLALAPHTGLGKLTVWYMRFIEAGIGEPASLTVSDDFGHTVTTAVPAPGANGVFSQDVPLTGMQGTVLHVNVTSTREWLALDEIRVFGPAPVPPAAPTTPTPSDGNISVPLTASLGWSTTVGAEGYDVYFWVPAEESKPLTPTASVTGISWTPTGFRPYEATYQWQVVATNAYGASAGPVWSFTTTTYPFTYAYDDDSCMPENYGGGDGRYAPHLLNDGVTGGSWGVGRLVLYIGSDYIGNSQAAMDARPAITMTVTDKPGIYDYLRVWHFGGGAAGVHAPFSLTVTDDFLHTTTVGFPDVETSTDVPITAMRGTNLHLRFSGAYGGFVGISEIRVYGMAPQPPTVAITNLTDGASVGVNFTIEASAASLGGTVTNVEFYDGMAPLGSDSAAPYSYDWVGASEGPHALTAVAWDDAGVATTSAMVNVTVTSGNLPPTASLASPTNGAVFVQGLPIPLAANASDDSAVARVDFYADGGLIGSDASNPYSNTWNGASVGSHALKAVAWDAAGLAGTSSVVNISVTNRIPYTYVYEPDSVGCAEPEWSMRYYLNDGLIGPTWDATTVLFGYAPSNDPHVTLTLAPHAGLSKLTVWYTVWTDAGVATPASLTVSDDFGHSGTTVFPILGNYLTFSQDVALTGMQGSVLHLNFAGIGFVGLVEVQVFGPEPAPPAAPTGPSPADGVVNVPTNTTLAWNTTVGASGYDVYLWVPAEGPKPLTPTARVTANNWTATGIRATEAAYQWQVVATNAYGATTGPVWTFTTSIFPYTYTYDDVSAMAENYPSGEGRVTPHLLADGHTGGGWGGGGLVLYAGPDYLANNPASFWPAITLHLARELRPYEYLRIWHYGGDHGAGVYGPSSLTVSDDFGNSTTFGAFPDANTYTDVPIPDMRGTDLHLRFAQNVGWVGLSEIKVFGQPWTPVSVFIFK